ncbi:hypothetical protein ACR3K2_38000 [Cryptosporidium serpentis]
MNQKFKNRKFYNTNIFCFLLLFLFIILLSFGLSEIIEDNLNNNSKLSKRLESNNTNTNIIKDNDRLTINKEIESKKNWNLEDNKYLNKSLNNKNIKNIEIDNGNNILFILKDNNTIKDSYIINNSNISKNVENEKLNSFSNINKNNTNPSNINVNILKSNESILNNITYNEFQSNNVINILYNLLEPGSNKIINFLEIHNNLIKVISKSNNKSNNKSNISDAYGMLTFLWFYGIPNNEGKNEFPNGWPRNMDIAIRYAIKGTTKYRCGFCYTLIGLLSAWGYPPIVSQVHGWLGSNNNNIFKKLDKEINIKETDKIYQNIYLMLQNPYKYSTIFLDKSEFKFPIERGGYDMVYINYALASKNNDIIGQIASSYYLRYDLTGISYNYDKIPLSSGFSLHRIPKNITSNVGNSDSSTRCLLSLEPLLQVASQTLGDLAGTFLDNMGYLIRSSKIPEHDTRHYAQFVKSLAAERDPEGLTSLGELYYYGHTAGGIARDVNRAAELWDEAARRGDPQGALARAFLHLDGTLGREEDAGPYLRQVARYGEIPASALANYYIYKLGINNNKNMTIAGEYLKTAADNGDGNAQLILAHAYAGGKMDVIPPGGINDTMALKYYKMSAKSGRTVALFNSAILTLKGSDKSLKTEESRCIVATEFLFQVVRRNPIVKLLHALSKKSYNSGDIIGSLLREMTLSEMGILEGHINSHDLWKILAYKKINNKLKNNKIIKYIKTNKFSIFENINLYYIISEYFKKYCKIINTNLENILNKQINIKFNNISRNLLKDNLNKINIISTNSHCLNYPNLLWRKLIGYLDQCIINLALMILEFQSKSLEYNYPIIESKYYLFFDPLDQLSIDQRAKLDIIYTYKKNNLNQSKLSDFLNCWTRPESYYSSYHNNFTLNNQKFTNYIQDHIKNNYKYELQTKLFYPKKINYGNLYNIWLGPYNGSEDLSPKNFWLLFLKIGQYIIKLLFKFPLLSKLSNFIFKYFNIYNDSNKNIKIQYNVCLWCSYYYAVRASIQGDIISTYDIIRYHLEGSFGASNNETKALEFLIIGVNNRDPKSLLQYILFVHKGIGMKSNKGKAYRMLRYLLFKGSKHMNEVLPPIPSDPKYIPTLLDAIRDVFAPFIQNGSSINDDHISFISSIHENIFNSTKNNREKENIYPEEDEKEQKLTNYKNKKLGDEYISNIQSQQEITSRIIAAIVLFNFTLDWLYRRYIYNIFNLMDIRKKSKSIRLYYQKNVKYSNSNIIHNNYHEIQYQDYQQIFDNNLTKVFLSKDYNYTIYSNQLSNKKQNQNKGILNYLFNIYLIWDFIEYIQGISPIQIIDNIIKYFNNIQNYINKNFNNKDYEFKKDNQSFILFNEYNEDPFPLSPRFGFASDEQYNQISNIWLSSFSMKLYKFILKIIIIICIISLILPINIAISNLIQNSNINTFRV